MILPFLPASIAAICWHEMLRRLGFVSDEIFVALYEGSPERAQVQLLSQGKEFLIDVHLANDAAKFHDDYQRAALHFNASEGKELGAWIAHFEASEAARSWGSGELRAALERKGFIIPARTDLFG